MADSATSAGIYCNEITGYVQTHRGAVEVRARSQELQAPR